MNSNLKCESMDELFHAILSLETEEECYNFFDDLCTIKELKSFAQRFQVARMLNNKIVFSEIAAITGASSATISRVNRSLNYGSDGYRNMIAKLSDQ
ncbi:MAG: YerC/YecD family TrpR-related protein [Oscillospiraceae bacterium]|nr:YerC/YecD family TrpR-related protein [Oscillospiraceae bacterium]